MVDWLNGILTSIWDFIKLLWEVLSDAIGAFFTWIFDAFIWVVLIPVRAIQWVWEKTVTPALEWVIDQYNQLNFNDFVSSIDLGSWNVGGLATALIDFNYVMGFAAGCILLLATVAFGKFLIKLIPGVG